MKWNTETLDNCNTLVLFCCILSRMLNRITDQDYWITIELICLALFSLGNLLVLIVAWRDSHSLKQAICQNKLVTFNVLLLLIFLIYLLYRLFL